MEPGYYPLLSEEEHHRLPYLSKSGIKRLLVSPLEYWLHSPDNYDPSAEKPTKDMVLGSARHCMLLEGDVVFERRYGIRPCPETHPAALRTVDDIRQWLKSQGVTPVGTAKASLVEQAKTVNPAVEILDELIAAAEESGRTMLPLEDWRSVDKSRGVFNALAGRLGKGLGEVTVIWDDPALGCRCKARLDWIGLSPDGHARIVELKDFAHQGRKCSLKSRTDQIFAHERHDIDMMFQYRAWKHAPGVVYGATNGETRLINEVRLQLPQYLPQSHPEMLVLYCRKDSDIPEFVIRSAWLADQGGSLTDMGQTAWASILRAADAYNQFRASHAFGQPWHSGWEIVPVEFEETSLRFA